MRIFGIDYHLVGLLCIFTINFDQERMHIYNPSVTSALILIDSIIIDCGLAKAS